MPNLPEIAETPSDTLPDAEIARRADAALRRALNTPPQPRHGKVKESKGRQRNAVTKPAPTKRGTATTAE